MEHYFALVFNLINDAPYLLTRTLFSIKYSTCLFSGALFSIQLSPHLLNGATFGKVVKTGPCLRLEVVFWARVAQRWVRYNCWLFCGVNLKKDNNKIGFTFPRRESISFIQGWLGSNPLINRGNEVMCVPVEQWWRKCSLKCVCVCVWQNHGVLFHVRSYRRVSVFRVGEDGKCVCLCVFSPRKGTAWGKRGR